MSMTAAAFRLTRRPPPFTVALHAGRLLEARVYGQMRSLAHVEEFADLVWRNINRANRSVVIIADYRRAMISAPERAEEWSTLMRSISPRVERSAILLDPHKATFNLQFQRNAVLAGERKRRLFFKQNEAVNWLDPVLDVSEMARLLRFFELNAY